MQTTQTKGSWKLAAARECAAGALEAAGFDPSEPGEPLSSEDADKIARMSASGLWDLPTAIVALARARTLTRTESARVIRGAFDTWTDIGRSPSTYSTPPEGSTFAKARKANARLLAESGYIRSERDFDPGRGRGRSCITPRQAAHIATLCASSEYEVPTEHLILAMRGLLTCQEASRLISAAHKTFMGAYGFAEVF